MPAPNDLKRELGNIAKKIGIEIEEMMDFAKPLYEEALNIGFSGGKLTIVEKIVHKM